MRKILFLSLLVISFTSYGQVKQAYNQYGGIWNRLALRYNGGFQLPRTTLSVKDLNVATPDSGQVYYNSTDSSIYLNAGTGSPWIKVGGSGTINSGVTGKPAYYVGATTLDDFAAVDYATSGTNMLLTTQNTTDVGLNIKGQSSQTANLQNWSSSAGTGDLGFFNASGELIVKSGGSDLGDYKIQTSSMHIPGSVTRSTFQLSTIHLQGVGINNAWIGENMYLGGSGLFEHDVTGAAGLFYFQGSEGQFRFYPSAVAGTLRVGANESQFKVNADGTVALGGTAINTTSGNYSGASMFANTTKVQFNLETQHELQARFKEISAPATPASGYASLYTKSDGLFYGKDDAGVETKLSNDAGGTPTLQQVLTAGATLTGDNTIVNDANTLTITGNTVAGDPILSITSTSTAAASSSQKGLNISLSGANATSTQTTYGVYSLNTHTGTSSTNIGLYSEVSGGTTNYAIRAITGGGSGDVGVFAESSGDAASVYGQNTSTGYAIYGYNGGGSGYGTYGTTSTGVGAAGVSTGTGGTGVQALHSTANNGTALFVSASGGSTTKIGAQIEAVGATNNYAIIVPASSGRIGFGTFTPSAQALLELVSTNQALLIMRMTATQASAITAADGMMLYVTDTNGTFTSVGFWGKRKRGMG